MIDDFYIDPRKHGGDGPGARRPEYVGADIEIDSNRILQSLQEKQPVILHGYGGPLLEHFVLVVGSQTDAAERRLVAFDPYPGSDRDQPGKQIEIKVVNRAMSHPTLSSVVFRNMRMVKAPESKPVTDSPPTTTGTDSVTMKDETVLSGKIQNPNAKFKTSYGEVEVKMNEVVSFQDSFLALSDGSSMKGNFSEAKFSFATPRGVLSLPGNEITRIVRGSASETSLTRSAQPTSLPMRAASAEGGSSLVGRVIDNFGKPLPGATVGIVNSRFSTLTDEKGNYALTYVPGKIQVSFAKTGYLSQFLSFEIAVAVQYPVQNVTLTKEPPGAGVFLLGRGIYIPLTQCEVRKKILDMTNPFLNIPETRMEWRFSVVGSPTPINSGTNPSSWLAGVLVFLDNDKRGLSLYRVSSPDNEFYRRTLIKDRNKYQYELIDDHSREINGVLIRTIPPDPGLYCSGRRIEDTFPFPELPQESAKSARVGAFASSCAFLWLCIP
ncbi:MAG: carboxypeptidase-like regulatory domain-containing protein [Verrucomicrobiota bacterium]